MPRRSVPAEPKILTPNYPSRDDNTVVREGVVAVSPYADHYELRWNVPNDNGDPIDSYIIRYCVVSQNIFKIRSVLIHLLLQTQKINGEWRDLEDQCSAEITQSFQHTSYDLNSLEPDTTYKIELRAHNAIGQSSPAQIRIRTARGEHQHYYSYNTYYNDADIVKVNIIFCFILALNVLFVQSLVFLYFFFRWYSYGTILFFFCFFVCLACFR